MNQSLYQWVYIVIDARAASGWEGACTCSSINSSRRNVCHYFLLQHMALHVPFVVDCAQLLRAPSWAPCTAGGKRPSWGMGYLSVELASRQPLQWGPLIPSQPGSSMWRWGSSHTGLPAPLSPYALCLKMGKKAALGSCSSVSMCLSTGALLWHPHAVAGGDRVCLLPWASCSLVCICPRACYFSMLCATFFPGIFLLLEKPVSKICPCTAN